LKIRVFYFFQESIDRRSRPAEFEIFSLQTRRVEDLSLG